MDQNRWFIVDSTQYRLFIELPSLLVGKFYKPPSICRDLTPTTHTAASQDKSRDSIGVQLVDIGSTATCTISTEPRMTPKKYIWTRRLFWVIYLLHQRFTEIIQYIVVQINCFKIEYQILSLTSKNHQCDVAEESTINIIQILYS